MQKIYFFPVKNVSWQYGNAGNEMWWETIQCFWFEGLLFFSANFPITQQRSEAHNCTGGSCRTFLCRHPESSRWSCFPLLAPCPQCPCVRRQRWRVTWLWAGWWGVVWADCHGPRWDARWGSWERALGSPGARCFGPAWGWSASSEVYCDFCEEAGTRQSRIIKT